MMFVDLFNKIFGKPCCDRDDVDIQANCDEIIHDAILRERWTIEDVIRGEKK